MIWKCREMDQDPIPLERWNLIADGFFCIWRRVSNRFPEYLKGFLYIVRERGNVLIDVNVLVHFQLGAQPNIIGWRSSEVD